VRRRQALQQRNETRESASGGDSLLVRLLDGQQADGEAGLLLKVIAAAWGEARGVA
jgi:hypothetical protein